MKLLHQLRMNLLSNAPELLLQRAKVYIVIQNGTGMLCNRKTIFIIIIIIVIMAKKHTTRAGQTTIKMFRLLTDPFYKDKSMNIYYIICTQSREQCQCFRSLNAGTAANEVDTTASKWQKYNNGWSYNSHVFSYSFCFCVFRWRTQKPLLSSANKAFI